jgi:hypothetical protein
MQDSSVDAPPSGVHAELAVTPDCPVADLASEVPVAEFVAPYGDGPPQLVVERGADLPETGVDVVATTEDSVVCRLPDRREACPHDRCPACDPGFLPVEPYAVEWRTGRLHLHVAASGSDEVRACLDRLHEAGVEAEPVGVATGGDHDHDRRAVVDVGRLTDRQRELAREAVEAGYFDPDGPSAAAVAADLDITKATLSEHLRTVQRELVCQAFAGANAER